MTSKSGGPIVNPDGERDRELDGIAAKKGEKPSPEDRDGAGPAAIDLDTAHDRAS